MFHRFCYATYTKGAFNNVFPKTDDDGSMSYTPFLIIHCTLFVILLQTFIEGVKSRLNQGIKPEDVGFQLAFSKQELRKVIKEYPGKEVCCP